MTTTRSTSRTRRRRAITSPRTWPTRRSRCSRTQARPTRRARSSCGSAPAPTTPRIKWPQEWADKYKGQFDDGYEAYREWVLPRMIEKGILPDGHPAHPDQPDAGRDVQPRRRRAALGLALRRREEALLPPGRGLRRLLRVHRRTRSAGSSSTWRTPGSSRTPSSSTRPTTAPPARGAPTARSTRTSSSMAGRTRSRRT